MQKLKKLSPYLACMFFCGALVFIIYAVKGIWPFGTGNITYDDMAQGTLPIYYHLYDWMHGDKALFFDWYTGLGVNIISSGTVTPLDFLLCLFKREDLLYGLGILIAVKLMAAAGAARFCFEKMFPNVNGLWKLLFSVGYAMSTFSLRYYTNSFWLDFVILFPFIIYGLKLLLEENKPALYTAAYCIALVLSVYQGFMVTLAVFLLSGLYILFVLKKEDRAQRTCTLGLATLTGGLLSCWHALPMAIQTLASKRLETSFEASAEANPVLAILNVNPFDDLNIKLTLVLGLQIALAAIAILLIKLLRERKLKAFAFVLLSCTVLLAPVIFESVNLIWHGGSYVNFPMRFFFIAVFFLMCLALYGIQHCGESLRQHKALPGKLVTSLLTVFFTAAFIYSLYVLVFEPQRYMSNSTAPQDMLANILVYIIPLALGTLLFIVLRFNEKIFARTISLVLCSMQIVAIGYLYMPDMKEREVEEYFYNNEAFVGYCNEVAELDTACGEFGRIKNSDTSLNTNYPFLLGTPALSNWTHTIPKYMQDAASVLGYSTQYTRVLDNGGTALTDGMFNIKKLIIRNRHSVPDQYKLIGSTAEFDLYENQYALEFGLLGGDELLQSITDISVNERFEVQNKLWQIFSGTNDLLFDVCTQETDGQKIKLVSAEEGKLVFLYAPTEHEILYINAGAYNNQSYKLTLNGDIVLAPYNKQTGYSFYPSASVNGLLTLGSFYPGETAEITVECINGEAFKGSTVQLGSMPIEKLTELNELYKDTVSDESTGKTSLSFNYSNNQAGKYLFVPITYDEGWSCKINGEKAEIHKALGAYIAIALPEGEGSVELKWQPKGFTAGILLTLAGVLPAAFITVMKKRKIQIPKPIAVTVFILFAAAVAVVLLAVYLIPISFQIIALIKNQ